MNSKNEVADKPVVTFSCNENQLSEEIIALKTLVFSILRNLPHETAIETISNLKGNSQNQVLTGLCSEMVDAMIVTTSLAEEN